MSNTFNDVVAFANEYKGATLAVPEMEAALKNLINKYMPDPYALPLEEKRLLANLVAAHSGIFKQTAGMVKTPADLVKRYVAADDVRYYLRSPIARNGAIYATDGHRAIRLVLTPEHPLYALSQDDTLFLLPDLTPIPPTMKGDVVGPGGTVYEWRTPLEDGYKKGSGTGTRYPEVERVCSANWGSVMEAKNEFNSLGVTLQIPRPKTVPKTTRPVDMLEAFMAEYTEERNRGNTSLPPAWTALHDGGEGKKQDLRFEVDFWVKNHDDKESRISINRKYLLETLFRHGHARTGAIHFTMKKNDRDTREFEANNYGGFVATFCDDRYEAESWYQMHHVDLMESYCVVMPVRRK